MNVFDQIITSEADWQALELGRVSSIATTKVTVVVDQTDQLQDAQVGRLVITRGQGGDEWLVGTVESTWRRHQRTTTKEAPEPLELLENEEEFSDSNPEEGENNGLEIVLLGTYKGRHGERRHHFSRSLLSLPSLDAALYRLEGAPLEEFLKVLANAAEKESAGPLDIGEYSLAKPGQKARALLDANRLFQRHAALIGSTGTGKSWTVATLLERMSDLPHSSVILFDIHGEYRSLDYAQQLRIAGPADLREPASGVLFLPYWLLAFEELGSLLVEATETSAPNQMTQLHRAVTQAKNQALSESGRGDGSDPFTFTVDSPIPFDLDTVVSRLRELDEELVEGKRGSKRGPYHGQLGRLLDRLERRRSDKRYGFLYQVPSQWLRYEALHELAACLMAHGVDENGRNRGIKVLDFSEMPSEVLPTMVGLVARLVFQLQLWSQPDREIGTRHPLLMICDEAHHYMPAANIGGVRDIGRSRSVFERIAREGRKHGVGLFVVSQRPSDLSPTVLAQCHNFICLRLSSSDDQKVVGRMLPESTRGLLEMLPTLRVGEAIVVGTAVLLPLKILLDAPKTPPLSASIPFWDRWSRQDVSADWPEVVEALRRQGRTKPS